MEGDYVRSGRKKRRMANNQVESVEGNENDGGFNLSLLPDVAKGRLVLFLEPHDILNLRLVCKSLKLFIDQPLILKFVPVKITTSKQLQKITASRVPFTNFILRFKSVDEQTHFRTFSSVFATSIRRLNLESLLDRQDALLTMLTKCKQLEELELHSLHMSILKHEKKLNLFEEFQRNGNKGLKKLIIHQFIAATDVRTKAEIEFFLKLIERANEITEFKIPQMENYVTKLGNRHHHRSASAPLEFLNEVINQNAGLEVRGNPAVDLRAIHEFDEEENWELDAGVTEEPDSYPEWKNEDTRDPLIHGIIELIKNGKLNKLRRIFVEPSSPFELKPLEDLILLCNARNISLADINSSQLTRLPSPFFSSVGPEFFNCFESINVNEVHKSFPLQKITKVNHIFLRVVPRSSHLGLKETEELKFPHLKSLRVTFLFDVSQSENQLLIKQMFKDEKRPSVEILEVNWALENFQSLTINGVDITRNFPNLRELTLNSGLTLTDKDCILIWESLDKLEKVVVKECRNLTNKAFIGNCGFHNPQDTSRRPFNRLKNLKYLRIRDITGKINETALLYSFRWMPLRIFIFNSTVIQSFKVRVYHSVGDSPLGKSVEQFVAPDPEYGGPLIRLERQLRTKFTNLRRPLFK